MRHIILTVGNAPKWQYYPVPAEAYWWGNGKNWVLLPLIGLAPVEPTLPDAYFVIGRDGEMFVVRQGQDTTPRCLLMVSMSTDSGYRIFVSEDSTGKVLVTGETNETIGVAVVLEPGQRLVLENHDYRWFFRWDGKIIHRCTRRVKWD